VELGGNITLVGFSEREFAEVIVIKKIVGQYARKLHDTLPDFQHLTITMKEIHTEHKKFELHAKADVTGSSYSSEVVDRNLFVALDSVLKKIIAQVH